MKKIFSGETPMKVAAFMSGSGTNLRKIIELQNKLPELFSVVVIFSETKGDDCKAKLIGNEHNIPVHVKDLMDFYLGKGYDNKRDLKVREEFDKEIVVLLEKYETDMVALCGYESLVTKVLCDVFPIINVHPGDLTKKDNEGRRKYTGLGWKAIRKALVNGENEVRSTTHVVTTELDGGPVIMVSAPLSAKVDDETLNDKEKLKDKCISIQKELKEMGDWKIYPETIKLIAQGRISLDEGFVFFDGKKIDNGIRYETLAEV